MRRGARDSRAQSAAGSVPSLTPQRRWSHGGTSGSHNGNYLQPQWGNEAKMSLWRQRRSRGESERGERGEREGEQRPQNGLFSHVTVCQNRSKSPNHQNSLAASEISWEHAEEILSVTKVGGKREVGVSLDHLWDGVTETRLENEVNLWLCVLKRLERGGGGMTANFLQFQMWWVDSEWCRAVTPLLWDNLDINKTLSWGYYVSVCQFFSKDGWVQDCFKLLGPRHSSWTTSFVPLVGKVSIWKQNHFIAIRVKHWSRSRDSERAEPV